MLSCLSWGYINFSREWLHLNDGQVLSGHLGVFGGFFFFNPITTLDYENALNWVSNLDLEIDEIYSADLSQIMSCL